MSFSPTAARRPKNGAGSSATSPSAPPWPWPPSGITWTASVAAIVETESGFSPDRVSPQGAMGLMQVLPSTGEDYGAQNLLDPGVNLDVGSRYLGELITDFRGNLELAVAAYNAGPGAVERYGGVPPYRETKDYVKRVLTLYGEHHRTAGAGRDPFAPPRFGG